MGIKTAQARYKGSGDRVRMIRLGGNLLLIVQKYGGTSVADKKRIMNAASRIAEAYRSGNRLVVVVSAQGSTTDELIKSAEDIDPDASGRELDMLLSTGEQQSAALMAMALKKMGLPANSEGPFFMILPLRWG